MLLDFEDRPSESPFVERVWRNQTERSGEFTSIASSNWQLCVWKLEGKTYITLRGPETKPSPAIAPAGAEFLGIVFKLGSYMPQFPVHQLVDSDINLPDGAFQSFWLHGAAWQYPDYDNVETFVSRLVREGLLVTEPAVDTAQHGRISDISLRSVQRRFVQATGMTHGATNQIERARQATLLLKHGVSINDTVDLLYYADQPHLTRSLRRWIGFTPAQLLRNDPNDQLSFLFKTPSFSWDKIQLFNHQPKDYAYEQENRP